MAPNKRPRQELMNSWIKEHDCFKVISDLEIYCTICSVTLKCLKKSRFTDHLKADAHRNPGMSKESNFYNDLCETFVVANIPFRKLDNHLLKYFLTKYTGRSIPNESTLRKNYLPRVYTKVINKIRSDIGDNYYWFSADETVDVLGRSIVHVIVGVLYPDHPTKPYLIAGKIIKRANAKTITEVVLNSIDNIFEDMGKPERALLFVSGDAAYMLQTGKLLKTIFKNMLHITCTARALHRVAEFIEEQFPNVNELINHTREVFLKAPARVALYREKLPALSLPPSPAVTRWGTWIEASSFYSDNLEKVSKVINNFNEDAQSITKCKTLLQDPSLQSDLYFINEHFRDIPEQIKYLESQTIQLKDRIETLDTIINKLKNISGDFGASVSKKIDAIFKRSPDLFLLKLLCNQSDEAVSKHSAYISHLHYAPLTSCDVERSFSIFKDVLTNKRTHFTAENLEYILVINVNSSLLT